MTLIHAALSAGLGIVLLLGIALMAAHRTARPNPRPPFRNPQRPPA